MRREQKAEKSRRERPEQSRALRVQLAEKERERERKYTSDFSYLFLLFFGCCVVDFFAFFRPNLGAQIEALESFTKREIPQRYIKFN